MMSDPTSRLPHAVLDPASRRMKALKIERLLQLDRRPGPLRLLEVGTGSGGIAHYFGTHPSARFEVDAVDVVDNRLVTEGFRYVTVSDTQLPFADESFDVVLSNHVIEHVGDHAAQMRHLRELRRVMAPHGTGYLAVPNRWMLVEPHYRLPFLSWLPTRWRSPYLRAAGKGAHYDCVPLQLGEIEAMFAASGLLAENLCAEALRLTLQIERPGSIADRVQRRIPDVVLHLARRIIPTLIYRFHRSS
jgi:SAM-dependent methyltransferase